MKAGWKTGIFRGFYSPFFFLEINVGFFFPFFRLFVASEVFLFLAVSSVTGLAHFDLAAGKRVDIKAAAI